MEVKNESRVHLFRAQVYHITNKLGLLNPFRSTRDKRIAEDLNKSLETLNKQISEVEKGKVERDAKKNSKKEGKGSKKEGKKV